MAYLQRPLGVIALFIAALAAGLFCLPRLPVSLLPSLSQPRLTVVTRYEHATPQEVDSLVTRRLESVLGTVAGLRGLESISQQGVSRIGLAFDWERSLTDAAAEVREKLDAAIEQLPREAAPPLVLPYDPSQTPLITLALSGGKSGLLLRDLADQRIKPRLLTLPGVAAVGLMGGLTPEIQVLVDKARLAAYGLDLASVVKGIKQANLNSPAGELRMGQRNMPVRTVGRFQEPGQINEAPLAAGETQAPLTVDQVARVLRTHKDQTGFARSDGKDAVLVSVLKAQDANALEVSERVKQVVLALNLPEEVKLEVVEDQAPIVEASLNELAKMVLMGGGLAILVLWIFIRRIGAALLVALAAPLGLFITFGLMNLFGVGLNLMSIGGLALGVGMLLDGSIVVLEAFERRRKTGLTRLEAARQALHEVGGSLITGTLTTAVVLVPVFFMTGLSQRLFADFSFTLAASLIVSLATGLLLLPSLLVWRGEDKSPKAPASAAAEAPVPGAWLWLVRLKWLLAPLAVVIALGSYWLAGQQGLSLLPSLGEDRLLITLKLPTGSGVERLLETVKQAEGVIRRNEQAGRLIVRAGRLEDDDLLGGPQGGQDDQARLTLYPKPGADLAALAASLRGGLVELNEARVQVAAAGQASGLSGEGPDGPELVVLLSEERGALGEAAVSLARAFSSLGFIKSLEPYGLANKRQIDIKVQRENAALRGVSVSQIARSVGRAVQGEVAGQLLAGDRQIDIRVRLRPEDRSGMHSLEELPLASPQGGALLLGEAARLSPGKGPMEIIRRHRRPAAVIQGRMAGLPAGIGQERAYQAARGVELPKGVELKPGSGRRELLESIKDLGGALGLALALVYVILVVRFESLRWPLVILFGLPAAALGPALVLHYLNLPLDALVLLGAVVLLGVAVNGSILLVDLAGSLRASGMPGGAALARACKVRLKPLVMTTLTTVLGAGPLCLELGRAAGLSRPLALTVVSGLLTALIGTLILVPAIYALLGGLKAKDAK
jgi:HAE1 family hydrophobic/amphiphilic exporter-1